MKFFNDRKRRPATTLWVYGEGGHASAMGRLVSHLDISALAPIQLVECNANLAMNAPVYEVPRIMPKRREWWRKLFIIPRLCSNLFRISVLFWKYEICSMVTTGPSIAVIPAIFLRLTGRKVVFIESWCRFKSVSVSGRILSALGCTIYYQNYQLAQLLPRGKYCGRL